MVLIEWRESFSVGIELFDQQHKELLKMLNEVFEVIRKSKNDKALAPVLTRLEEYVEVHFGDEERKMRLHDFNGYADHKKEHQELTASLKDLRRRFNPSSTGLSVPLMRFLESWLVDHIIGTDMKYKPFFQNKGLH